MHSWPGRMKSEGFETVQIQTVSGGTIPIRVRYYRRTCDRRKGKRYKGLYAALALLGIHGRCTPILAAMVSAWSALLSSFEEVRQVLCDHGTILDVKVIRKLAYRYAERARVVQQMGMIGYRFKPGQFLISNSYLRQYFYTDVAKVNHPFYESGSRGI